MSEIETLNHYENLLASEYNWIWQGLESNIKKNTTFFEDNSIVPNSSKFAIDLGAGSGFQSIPLSKLGFNVFAIDFSFKILTELASNVEGLKIETIQSDIMDFENYPKITPELVVCMGDTITHINDKDSVIKIFEHAYNVLLPQGKFVLSYRDLTSVSEGLDRFIPVNSDENKIFTCFLEDIGDYVNVNDLIYKKEDNKWILHKSCYKKLKLSNDFIKKKLESIGFKILMSNNQNNVFTFICQK